MKRQDLTKYHQQTLKELEAEIAKKQVELVDVSLKLRLNQIKNRHSKKTIRQDIAKLKTLMTIKTQQEK